MKFFYLFFVNFIWLNSSLAQLSPEKWNKLVQQQSQLNQLKQTENTLDMSESTSNETRKNLIPRLELNQTQNFRQEILKKLSGSTGVGNGGDYYRRFFIAIGLNILENYQEGFKSIGHVLEKAGYQNYLEIKEILTIKLIKNSFEILKDNQGIPVSATASRGEITLYVGNQLPELSWEKLLTSGFRSEKIVLHEILRAIGINDDDFVFSKIVLTKADVKSLDPFHTPWTLWLDFKLNTALKNGFNASLEEEGQIYQQTIIEAIENTSFSYAELATLPLRTMFGHKVFLKTQSFNLNEVLYLRLIILSTLKNLNGVRNFLKLNYTKKSMDIKDFNQLTNLYIGSLRLSFAKGDINSEILASSIVNFLRIIQPYYLELFSCSNPLHFLENDFKLIKSNDRSQNLNYLKASIQYVNDLNCTK